MGGELGVAAAAPFGVGHDLVDAGFGALRGVVEDALQPGRGVGFDREELEARQSVALLSLPVCLPFEHARQGLRWDVQGIADRGCLQCDRSAAGRVESGPAGDFLPESDIRVIKYPGGRFFIAAGRQGPGGGCVGVAFEQAAFDEESDADAGVRSLVDFRRLARHRGRSARGRRWPTSRRRGA